MNLRSQHRGRNRRVRITLRVPSRCHHVLGPLGHYDVEYRPHALTSVWVVVACTSIDPRALADGEADVGAVVATTSTDSVWCFSWTMTLSVAFAWSTSTSTDVCLLVVVSTTISGVCCIPESQSGSSRDMSVRDAVIESVREWMLCPTETKGIESPSTFLSRGCVMG